MGCVEFRHFRLHTVLWDPPGARGSHLKSQKRQSGLLEPKTSRGKIVELVLPNKCGARDSILHI